MKNSRTAKTGCGYSPLNTPIYMDADAGELLDWEVLQSSSNSDSESGFGSSADSLLNDFEGEVDSLGNSAIQSNYFSIESGEERYARASGEERYARAISEGSESSENPSWIEPTSDSQYPSKFSPRFWSDSGSDPGDQRKLSEFEGESEVGLVGHDELEVGTREIEEFVGGNSEKLEDDTKMGAQGSGIACGDMEVGDLEENNQVGFNDNKNLKVGDDSIGVVNVEVESGKVEEGDTRKTVGWWKVPMELIKFCVFRVNPLWTFSTAAAFIGFVFLGKRLYNMKKKAKALKLKVTMDDKKVSQFMSRAARLNEAFSAVKRVPVIRPTFPVVGVTPWPVMSLR